MRDVSSETPDVTSKCTCYDLTNLLVGVLQHIADSYVSIETTNQASNIRLLLPGPRRRW